MKKWIARLLVMVLALMSALPMLTPAEEPPEELVIEAVPEVEVLTEEEDLGDEDIEVVPAPAEEPEAPVPAEPTEEAAVEAGEEDVPVAKAVVKEFKLTKDDQTTLNVGDSLQIVLEGKAIAEAKSGKAKVATATKDGLVKAVAEGKAKITVVSEDKKKLKLTVNVVDPYKPDSVSFAKSSITMNVGDSLTLEPVLKPDTAKTTYTWKSGKAKVASISAKGEVKALTEGKAKITVQTSNKKKATVEINVVDPYKPDSVSFAKSSITMNVGDSLTLEPVLKPDTAKTTYTWKSGKAKVASISAKGEVKALTEGKAKITVQTSNKKKATVEINVIDPYKPDSVSFAKNSYTLKVGETLTLEPVLKPSTAKTTYTWKSSKEKVASVSAKGEVKALTEGKAKITVQTSNKKKAIVEINVVDPYKPDSVSFAKGSITMNVGDSLTLEPVLKPDTAKTTYTWKSSKVKVASITAKGEVKALTEGKTKITVQTSNKKKATVEINVVDIYKHDSVRFSQSEYTVYLGKPLTLVPILKPTGAKALYSWKSDNVRVATVSSDGVVEGKSVGTAYITVSTSKGKTATATIKVERYDPVTNIELSGWGFWNTDGSEKILWDSTRQGEYILENQTVGIARNIKKSIHVELQSDYNKKHTYTYSSSNPSVISVSDDKYYFPNSIFLKALKKGMSTITVTADTGMSASVTIKVFDNKVDNLGEKPTQSMLNDLPNDWYLRLKSVEVISDNEVICEFYLMNGMSFDSTMIRNLHMHVSYNRGSIGNPYTGITTELDGSFPLINVKCPSHGFAVIKLKFHGDQVKNYYPNFDLVAEDLRYLDMFSEKSEVRDKFYVKFSGDFD